MNLGISCILFIALGRIVRSEPSTTIVGDEVAVTTILPKEGEGTILSKVDPSSILSNLDTTDVLTKLEPSSILSNLDTADIFSKVDPSAILSEVNAVVSFLNKDKTTISSEKVPTTISPREDAAADLLANDESTIFSEIDTTTIFSKDVATSNFLENGRSNNADITTSVNKQTYKEAEKEITDYINSLLRSLLPQIVGGTGDAKLTSKCTAAMMKVFGYIRRMKGWTLKMLDSMGKPASGILKGTSYSMGNYDQCLDLSVTKKGEETTDSQEEMFRGRYCRVKITLPEVIIEYARNYNKGIINATVLGKLKEIIQVIPYIPVKSNYMIHYVGLCFPSICTSEDLEQLVQLIPFPGNATIDRCEMKTHSEVDFMQLLIIYAFVTLCVIVVASTFFDWLMHTKRKGKSSLNGRENKCVSVCVAFSLCNNTKRLMRNIEDESDSLLAGQSVRGIFVASVAWIVLGYTYLFPYEGYYFHMSSLENLRNYWDEGYFSMIMTFPLAIDALFVCYGFLLTYSLWYTAIRPEEVSVNVISLLVKDYIRLSIPLLLCFGTIFLLPLTGSGPFWGDILEDNVERCRQNFFAYIGMYSNFLELEEQCFPHLWFVSCLSQLTFVGIFLSWILSRSARVGIWITIVLCTICNGAVGVISYKNNYPPSYVAYFTDESSSDFWKINMALPLSHFGSYAVGMLAGIFIARRDNRRNRGCLGIIGWLACLGLLYAIHLVLYNSRNGSLDPIWSAIFAGVHRTAFALCVAWVMVACSYGIGGFVNGILSWRVFDPLFRLSYYAYLFHFIVISFIVSVARGHFSYNHLELVLRASSYLGLTYFIVYFMYMILEMPLISLKDAFCSKKTCQIEVTPLQTFTPNKGDFISRSSVEGSVKLWSITESQNGLSY